VRTFADLGDREIDLVATAWQLRALAAREEGFAYVHALVNEGRLAGASLAHSHSQLVSMRDAPPAVVAERHGECGVCTVLATEEPLAWRGDVGVYSAAAARAPYELLVAPRSHDPEPAASAASAALVLLRESIRRLRAVEGPVPWNAWLHTGDHWHLEVVPRLTVLAGIELGAGVYVNTLAPEDAAAALRAAAP
jgi:UDPglucose--hexose-1-phosphate uridylyltransferase